MDCPTDKFKARLVAWAGWLWLNLNGRPVNKKFHSLTGESYYENSSKVVICDFIGHVYELWWSH